MKAGFILLSNIQPFFFALDPPPSTAHIHVPLSLAPQPIPRI